MDTLRSFCLKNGIKSAWDQNEIKSLHVVPNHEVVTVIKDLNSSENPTLKNNFRNAKRRNGEKKKNQVQEREVVTDPRVIKDQTAKNILK